MVHIKELKVRPRKRDMQGMCGLQLVAMLGCWSATKDFHSLDACKSASETLLHCMRSTVPERRLHRPAINYHLARLKKRI